MLKILKTIFKILSVAIAAMGLLITLAGVHEVYYSTQPTITPPDIDTINPMGLSFSLKNNSDIFKMHNICQIIIANDVSYKNTQTDQNLEMHAGADVEMTHDIPPGGIVPIKVNRFVTVSKGSVQGTAASLYFIIKYKTCLSSFCFVSWPQEYQSETFNWEFDTNGNPHWQTDVNGKKNPPSQTPKAMCDNAESMPVPTK